MLEARYNGMIIFAERFRELRGEKSQAEFATFLGISRPTVGFYENGDRLPDAGTLKKIAEKCQVPSDWLLGLINVKSLDVDTIGICQKTGLTQGAVENLLNEKHDADGYKKNPYDLDLAEAHQSFAMAASLFLEDYSAFYHLAQLISEYYKAYENQSNGINAKGMIDLFLDMQRSKREDWEYISPQDRLEYDLYKIKQIVGKMIEESAEHFIRDKKVYAIKEEVSNAQHNPPDE